MSKLRIGVFGAGRGMDLAKNFMLLGCDVVALCDFHEKRLEAARGQGGALTCYDDFDAFVEYDMDAVIAAALDMCDREL